MRSFYLLRFWWWCVYLHMYTRTLMNMVTAVVTYVNDMKVLITKLISFTPFLIINSIFVLLLLSEPLCLSSISNHNDQYSFTGYHH